MKRWWREGVLFLIALGVMLADQGTKLWAIDNLRDGRMVPVVGDILRLRYTTNTGAAFGLFQDQGFILAIIALVVVTAILIYYRRMPGQLLLVQVSLGLQLGGAIGNLLDRLYHGGSVVDFIEFVLWPVFNIADAAIVAGVGLLAYYLIFLSPAEAKLTPDVEREPSDVTPDV